MTFKSISSKRLATRTLNLPKQKLKLGLSMQNSQPVLTIKFPKIPNQKKLKFFGFKLGK
jgi:hypothetical protein